MIEVGFLLSVSCLGDPSTKSLCDFAFGTAQDDIKCKPLQLKTVPFFVGFLGCARNDILNPAIY